MSPRCQRETLDFETSNRYVCSGFRVDSIQEDQKSVIGLKV